MSIIVGRKSEIQELESHYQSDRPEFIAVYGRRRVGKTFLIKQTFKGRITFQHTGVSPVDLEDEKNRLKTQLENSILATTLPRSFKPHSVCHCFSMVSLRPSHFARSLLSFSMRRVISSKVRFIVTPISLLIQSGPHRILQEYLQLAFGPGVPPLIQPVQWQRGNQS